MMRRTLFSTAVILSAVFSFYLPSSIGGDISRPLSVLSIAGTCSLLAAMLLLSPRLAPLLNIVLALLIPALLFAFTVRSPFRDYSPGVVALYGAQSLLFVLSVGKLTSRHIEWVFQTLVAVSLAFGFALVLDVQVADHLVLRSYNAFYSQLASNMVITFNKPVLTFATHSMAGYMIYLLFVMELRSWQARDALWRAAAAGCLLALLWHLRSSTATAFLIAGVLEMGWALFRRYGPRPRTPALVATVVALTVALILGLRASDLPSRIGNAVVGDRVGGFLSRYADGGLLAPNFRYLSASPFTPIGASATDALYAGDSGILVNLLRGSIPLALTVYFGLWLFFVTNLANVRDGTQLWLATILFETGFTPLMYFRFLGFAPFLVAYLRSLPVRVAAADGSGLRPAAAAPEVGDPHEE